MRRRFRLFMTLFALLALAGAAAPAALGQGGDPAVGQKAPDFALPWANRDGFHLKPEEHVTLSGLKGKIVVLAFYPADWSPGCTTEVCTLRDDAGFSGLDKLDAVIYGVSGDYVFSHYEWAKHHNLAFSLLSDHDHAVARAYGSYNADAGFNKRTVFVLDRDGVVRYKNLNFRASSPDDYKALREAITAAHGK